MKKLLCFLVLAGFTKALAQDSSLKKINELYITANNFSPLSIQLAYKHQLKEKTFFKLSLLDLSYSQNNNDGNIAPAGWYKNTSYRAGLNIGLEFRSSLDKPFAFYHGPNLSFSSSVNVNKTLDFSMREQTTTNASYTPGIAYTLGALMRLKGQFYLAVELNPGIYYNTRNFSESSYSLYAGLNNYGGYLFIAYRF